MRISAFSYAPNKAKSAFNSFELPSILLKQSHSFMAANLYSFFLLIIISSIPQSSCQSGSPQNIETHYPFPLTFLPPTPPPNPPKNQPVLPPTSPVSPPPKPPPLPVLPTSSPSSSSSKKTVGAAVGITAASTLILSGLFFFLIHRYSKRKKDKTNPNPYTANPVPPQNEFMRFSGNLKGVIVDEDGLDVIYWRNLQGEAGNKGFEKQSYKNSKPIDKEQEKKVINTSDDNKYEPPSSEIPLLRGKSSTSQSTVWNDHVKDASQDIISRPYGGVSIKAVSKQDSSIQLGSRSPPQPPAPAPPPPPPPPPPTTAAAAAAAAVPLAAGAVAKGKGPLLPPPPPIPPRKVSSPAPPPPPLPKARSEGSPSKPPPMPKGLATDSKGKQPTGEGGAQVKLKPLHWDKVNPHVEHSMVWDKIGGGSFK